LIDVRQVATKTNGGQIFSYINIKNAYTQGIETELSYRISKQLTTSAGYQLLLTADKDEINNIKAGTVFTKNDDGTSRLMRRSEYTGLANRSKHMANFKVNYENKKGWFANARFIYRSKWYVSDKDGNGVYNTNDTYAKGFLLVNVAAGKKINNRFSVQGGMDNCTNHTDMNYLPNMQGRMIYIGFRYEFFK
jgi:outer membrane receptor for ferrienterochelin and colicins